LPVAARDIFPDPGFEASGEEGVAHSGQRALHISVAEGQYWAAAEKRLTVEPFATYRASGWFKGSVNAGSLTALHGYVYDSTDWRFSCGVRMRETFDWQEVQDTFISPFTYYRFSPLAFLNAGGSEAWADDIVVEQIKSPEETMTELLAREKPSGDEQRLITRYLVSRGETDQVRALAEAATGLLRADTFCVLAAGAETPEEKLRYVTSAIEAGVMGSGEGPRTAERLLKGFSDQQRLAAYQAGAKLEPGSRAASQAGLAIASIYLKMAGEASTCQATGDLLERARKEAEDVMAAAPDDQRTQESGKELLAKMSDAQEKLEERKASLGHCTIRIGGQRVTPVTHTIVTSEQASPCELYAAQELQKYLERITGEVLPVKPETEDLDGGMILVGAGARTEQLGVQVNLADLGEEGLLIRTVGPHLIVAGGRVRGTLYGVYSLLEEYLGCGWFRPGPLGEVIPREGEFALTDINLVQMPSFEWRNMSGVGDAAWMVRNKLDPTGSGDSYGVERGDVPMFGSRGHAFDRLCPPSRYFISNPEYYALVNGKRIWDGGQLCTSNPEVIKICAETLMEQMRQRPNCKIFSCVQDDGYGWCECESCRALDVQPDLMTDRLMTFVNAVAEITTKEFPDKYLLTLAYTQKNTEPPFKVKPAKNVVIWITHYSPCCHVHPIATCPKNATQKRQIEGWAGISHLYVYDYRVDFAHYLMPYPTSYAIAADIPYYRDVGVKGIFYQGGASDAQFGVCQYLIAKLMWNPDLELDEILDRLFTRYFEAAGPPMERYFHLLHDPVRDQDIHMNLYSAPPAELFTPELFEAADACFDEALALAPSDLVRRRVELERLPLYYVKLAMSKQTRAMRIEGDQLRIEAPRAGASWRQDLASFIRIARDNNVFSVRENASTPKYVDVWVEKILGMRVHNLSEYRYLKGAEAHEGQRCVYVRGAVEGSLGGWSRSGLILKPGTAYTASAWVRIVAAEDAQVRCVHVSGSGVSASAKPTATEDWQRVETSFVTPDAPAISVTFHPALLTNQGEVSADDVSLVADDAPERNLVGNPGFEKARGTMPDGWKCPVKRNFIWTTLPPVSDFLADPDNFPVETEQQGAHRIVPLENEVLRAEILPSLGGRILRMIDRRTSRNFTYVPEQLQASGGWLNYGGYEEYSGMQFPSPGWEEAYECELKRTGNTQQATLSASLSTGFRLVRELSLADGAAELRIKSTLTNVARTQKTTRFRVHPIFSLEGDAAQYTLVWKASDGKRQRMSLRDFGGSKWLQEEGLPQGWWALVNEKKPEALVNLFDPAQVAKCYLCAADPGSINLELMSPEVTLPPGGSVTIEHSYRLLRDLEELPR